MTGLTVIQGTGTALHAAPFLGRHRIGGRWQDNADGATFDRHCPAAPPPLCRARGRRPPLRPWGRTKTDAAALARTLHGDSLNSLGPDMLGVVLREPVGVVSILTAWNFPFWILAQKLPFALAAGCTCGVKPSQLTPSTTVIPGALPGEAGLPDGVGRIRS